MPARRIKKHKKSYVCRPIGTAGKTYRFIHRTRNYMYLGGGSNYPAPDATVTKASAFDWQYIDSQFQTPTNPIVMGQDTPSLRDMLFEQGWDGTAVTSLKEAKYPDLFNFRYINPVYYGQSVRVFRARTIIQSEGHANDVAGTYFYPSSKDLIDSQLSTQIPVVIYWRYDYSNLNAFYQFHETNSLTTGGGTVLKPDEANFYKPTHQSCTNSTKGLTAQNFHEMLLNKRFARCVIQPGQDCIMQGKARFPVRGMAGNMADVLNTTAFSAALANDLKLTQWLRYYNSLTTVPGQDQYTSYGLLPGDLYMTVQLPEVMPDQKALLLVKDDVVDKPKARLCIEYETTTTLILKATEWVPDTQTWGASGFPS